MANAEIDLTQVTSENLVLHLADFRLPEPIGWWPLAVGWWVLAGAMLMVAACYLWRRKGGSSDSTKPPVTDLLFDQLQIDKDTAAYWHQMTRLIREAAIGKAGRQAVASLHGESWVSWLEKSAGISFSPELQDLLRDECYRVSPQLPSRLVHNEMVSWLEHYSILPLESENPKVTDRA